MLDPRLSDLQIEIMQYVDDWGKIEGTPIPVNEIISEMRDRLFTRSRVIRAVRGLVKKKYIRRAVDRSSRSSYVQMRKV